MLVLKGISKSFTQGGQIIEVFKDINLKLKAGKLFCLLGPSGCGKSTLLHIAGLLEAPSCGTLTIDNINCNNLSDSQLTTIRGRTVGFVYQFHHLMAEFTALENVMMPLLILGFSKKKALEDASKILKEFGLDNRMDHLPSELSGGQQQRVAIARALVHKPKILLADEPTGNLDDVNSSAVFNELIRVAKKLQVAVLIATHNLELAKKADTIFRFNNGVLKKE